MTNPTTPPTDALRQAGRLAFALEVSAIDRDALLSDLTSDEIDSIVDGLFAAWNTRATPPDHFAAAGKLIRDDAGDEARARARAREVLAQTVEQRVADHPAYSRGKGTAYYIRDYQGATVAARTAIAAMLAFRVPAKPGGAL